MIVMEYVEKGSLFDIIHHTPQELTKDRVVSILGDIAAGMVHLQLLLLRCIKYRLRLLLLLLLLLLTSVGLHSYSESAYSASGLEGILSHTSGVCSYIAVEA
jgi:serine/threonine protein kinase